MITIARIGKKSVQTNSQIYETKIKSIKIFHIKEEKGLNIDLIKQEEGKKLLSKKNGFTIALSEDGEELDSISFSKLFEKHHDITFLIGGAFGLSKQVKQEADYILSMSKMTFPHEMAYIILLEQIYRAERILEGHPYHKV